METTANQKYIKLLKIMQSDFDSLYSQLKYQDFEDRRESAIQNLHIKTLREIQTILTEDERRMKYGIAESEWQEPDVVIYLFTGHLFRTIPIVEQILLKYFYQEKLKLMYLRASRLGKGEEITFSKWYEKVVIEIKLNNL